MQQFTNQKVDRGWKVHLVCFYFLLWCFVFQNEFSEMTLLFEMLSEILFSFMKCWVSEMPSCFSRFISDTLVRFAPQGHHRQKTQKTQSEKYIPNTDNNTDRAVVKTRNLPASFIRCCFLKTANICPQIETNKYSSAKRFHLLWITESNMELCLSLSPCCLHETDCYPPVLQNANSYSLKKITLLINLIK